MICCSAPTKRRASTMLIVKRMPGRCSDRFRPDDDVQADIDVQAKMGSRQLPALIFYVYQT